MTTYSLRCSSVEDGQTFVEMDHWEEEIDGGILEIAECRFPPLSSPTTLSFYRHVNQVGTYDITMERLLALQRGEDMWMTPKARYEWQTGPEDFDTTIKIVPYESASSSDSDDDVCPMKIYFTCRRLGDSMEPDEFFESDPENENRRLVPTSLGNLVWEYPKGKLYREYNIWE